MKPFAVAAFCACLVATLLSAADANFKANIVNDNFSDGSRYKTGQLDADWRSAQSIRSLTVVTQETDNPLVPEHWLKVTPGAGNYPTVAGIFDQRLGNRDGSGEGVSLGEKNGDKLELSLDFRFEEPATRDKEIRLGLFNNSGTTTLSDNAEPIFMDDVGYWVTVPQNGGPTDIYKKTGGKGTIVGGSDKILLVRAMGGPNAPPMGTNRHSLTLTLTRDSQGIVVMATLDGVILQACIDTPNSDAPGDPPGLYTVFQEIGVGTGLPQVNPVYLTNVKLQAITVGASVPRLGAASQSTGAPLERKTVFLGIAAGAGLLLLLIVTASVTWTLARRSAQKPGNHSQPE